MTGPRIPAEALRAFAAAVYGAAGMGAQDAALCADSLVQADLWGHQSHGMMRLSWYAARLAAGVCDPRAVPESVVDAGGLAVIDGREAMGQVVAAQAMAEAMARAAAHGIGAVAVRNSNHFGTAMYFTLMAARAGCIGFLSTNASPAMAPWGGRRKALGNNPWSWAAPAGRHAPLVLDIANTAVARGKIYLARQRGEAIPLGWAMDASGRPTADPQAAIDGLILPMAGHKGSAISAVMDVLSGVLTGSAFGAGVAGPYQAERRSGAGHLALAIDIARIQPLAEFEARMERFIAEMRAVPLAEGAEAVFYPGEIEARAEAENLREGVLLPEDTRADLLRLARANGLDPAMLGP
ncbi:Malate/L-lactate dehydrogenase [Methylobacterium sp. 4-46]|uniref:Ldh family oxidoreductase n=1 Tax=unclassified Methylobacterium TaxID=2615210 RepID=UPI000152DA54|nr:MULTISPECIES: Ldh family oxidoreductase [Methylobacterium]ACA17972.1 Malate/L-lactate dehydrogenase [Methylobacterium sp. 4-46]WFT77274.1 Ldh family oxidoreductase [Methylobacterium nodulans]